MKILAISRAGRYSPGRHAENDRLILERTVELLEQRGASVAWRSEDTLRGDLPKADLYLSMCQGPRGTELLLDQEARGAVIVNSPRAVKGCYRAQLFRRLGPEQREFPETVVVDTTELDRLVMDGPVWVKRGDVHSVEPGDVQRVDDHAALLETLGDFAARGIREAIVQRHAPGTVVKFYGVLDHPFFRYYAERDRELRPREIGQARGRIEALVAKIGLEIYGGDCVLGPDGTVSVIDINDWPSFAYFRNEAANAIVERVAKNLAPRFNEIEEYVS